MVYEPLKVETVNVMVGPTLTSRAMFSNVQFPDFIRRDASEGPDIELTLDNGVLSMTLKGPKATVKLALEQLVDKGLALIWGDWTIDDMVNGRWA